MRPIGFIRHLIGLRGGLSPGESANGSGTAQIARSALQSNAQTRSEWITALETIETLKPRAVIAGHKKADRDDSPGIIEETPQYIRDSEGLAAMTTTARELYDKMLEIYPDRANPGSLWGSSHVVKP